MAATIVRTRKTPTNVIGSLALTPKSNPLIAFVSIHEANAPISSPIAANARVRTTIYPGPDVSCGGAERHANSDLLGPLSDRIGDHAIDSERSENAARNRRIPVSRSTTKRRGEMALSTSCCKAAEIIAGQIRIDRLAAAASNAPTQARPEVEWYEPPGRPKSSRRFAGWAGTFRSPIPAPSAMPHISDDADDLPVDIHVRGGLSNRTRGLARACAPASR